MAIQILKRLILLSAVLTATLVLIGCVPEAPHSNPLDGSGSGAANLFTISGTVFNGVQPAQPQPDCQVELFPTGLLRITDSAGRFQFEELPAGEYQLVAIKDGFVADTISTIVSDTSAAPEVNFFLNAFPRIVRAEYYSEHIDQWWPGEIYQAVLSLIISDPDGISDIDSLSFAVPELGFSQTLQTTARADSFAAEIENLDLSGGSLQVLIEKGSWATVWDDGGASTEAGPFFLRRIIEEAPLPLAPINLQTTTAFPLLEWQPLSLAFSFNYIVQVFRINAGVPVLIHTSPPLSEAETSYTVTDSLSSGSYFWTIGVQDNLKNFSRSKEASFIVP